LPLLIHRGAEETHSVGSVDYLEHGLARAERLTAHAYSQALLLKSLKDLTLPHPVAADDEAHLRTLASLYLLSQLEQASLLPSVELLAGIGMGGGVSVDLGPAASKLMEFWRRRKERFSADERRHLFERVFDSDFENLMISLCEALYKLDEGVLPQGRSNPLEQAKLRTIGEQLTEHLLNHTTSESSFAAIDILASTREATEILKDAHVEHAFGAHTIWMTVTAILQRYGVPGKDPASFVVRGKAGLTILAWLADAHSVMNSSTQPLVGLDNPVISAAVDWLQSSLAIEQSKAAEQAPPANSPQSAEGA
jgi:hypothetical protein